MSQVALQGHCPARSDPATQTASIGGSAISMQGLHTGQEGRRELGKTGGALHCLSPEVTCVTSPNRQLTRTRHGVVNCLWIGETEMPGFAERKGEPDRVQYWWSWWGTCWLSNCNRGQLFWISVDPGVWTGLGFGLRGTHGSNLLQQIFT